MPLPVCTVAKREKGIVPPAPHSSPPAPPRERGGVPGSFYTVGRIPEAACKVAHCVCGGGDGGAVPRSAAAVSSGCHTPPPERAPDCAPSSRQRTGTVHPAPARRRPGPGPRSALGPSARFFVARPQRSIAPSPSPAAGKGHPRTGGGGAARGTLARAARRPSHPGRPSALPGCFWLREGPPARLAFPFCVSLISTSFCRDRLASVYFSLALLLLLFLVLSPTLRHSLRLSLRLTLSPRPPGDHAPSPPPS